MPSTSPQPDGVLYEPINRVNRGSSAENIRRGRSFKRMFCCRSLLFLVLASVVWGVFLLSKFAREMWKTTNVLHHDLILKAGDLANIKDKDLNKTLDVTSSISPLIRLNDPFSIRATVWLDVTQHLQQGHSLPATLANGSPSKIITYNVDANTTRSEMILYSDVIFKDIKSKERHYSTIPLSIPIDPFYTQELGPSTLRMTYTAEVESDKIEKELGKFQLGQGIFSFSSLVLPRSQSSIRIQKGCDGSKVSPVNGTVDLRKPILAAPTLEEALEINGASTALLSLRSTLKSKLPNCTHDKNVNLDYYLTPGFLDNAVDRRSFTQKTILDKQGRRLILANNCQMFSPVIETHSSIYLVRSNEDLDLLRYADRLVSVRKKLQPCFDEKVEKMPSHCSRELRMYGPLENWLTFRKNTSQALWESEMRYGPAIVQRQFATPPWEQKVLPRSRPTIDGQKKQKAKTNSQLRELFWFMKSHEKKKKDLLEKCVLPQIEVDDTNQFFTLDFTIRFGKDLGTLRSVMLETGLSHDSNQDFSEIIELEFFDEYEDEEMAIINSIKNDVEYETQSLLASDHFHPKRRGYIMLTTFLLSAFGSLVGSLLCLTYWYTRTTTAGLSIRAQWIQSIGGMITLSLILYDLSKDGIVSIASLYLIGVGLEFVLRILTLARIDFIFPQEGQSWLKLRIIQRPKNKSEKRCERVERQRLGWSKIGMVFGFFLVLCFISGREGFFLNRGRGCSMTLKEDDLQGRKKLIKQWLRQIGRTIIFTGHAIQIWFNTISPALHVRQRKLGSFAGMFKTSAYIDAFNLVWEQLADNVEKIGGHSVRREAIMLVFVQNSIQTMVLFWQALRYPGIPQVHGKDGKEEEEYDM